ncbi:carbohydrate ABC transporter permease [Ornithinibacillus halotolerans]|uniref:Sugar ABC transporter permease n=1 Tax=Ornithinibacillus halotolerans TaxID=1274357 RepID=A0A916SB86_9BACI|nr:sugar ABC transporter permease [Ornithinibacillus halotolerans]GGA92023.1 sugar ABC transporter permease [Ornithinibacillus halotolerans]
MLNNKGKPKKTFSAKRGEAIAGWLFISPMVVGFTIFMFAPLAYAFFMSLHEWPLLGEQAYIGLENYRNMMEDASFSNSLKVTILFSLGLVPLNIILALFLANLLKEKFWGIGFFRTAIFVPVMTSLVVWAIVWKYLLAPELGFINQMLGWIGINGPSWLLNPDTALPSVIVVSVLKNVGLNMILFLTAMQQVPKELYEAAELDGANNFTKFRNITFPLITPTVFLTLIITTIGAMKIFGQVYVMTNGGPGESTKVLVYYIWETAFKLFDMGYASALAFVLFFILLIFTIISWVVRKRWVFYED